MPVARTTYQTFHGKCWNGLESDLSSFQKMVQRWLLEAGLDFFAEPAESIFESI